MFYHTETKPQTWRALAVFTDGSQCLLYLGRSTTQIRAGYEAAFQRLLGEADRARVEAIRMECWDGAPDLGRWVAKAALSVPGRARPRPAVEAEQAPAAGEEVGRPEPRILRFKRGSAAGSAVAPAVPVVLSLFRTDGGSADTPKTRPGGATG